MMRLKSQYEACFSSLQDLTEHPFLVMNTIGGGTGAALALGGGGANPLRVSTGNQHNNPLINPLNNIAFESEQVELLRKKIGCVGEFLQDTVTKHHLTSKLLISTAKYLQSLVSIKKALKMLGSARDRVLEMTLAMIPFSDRIFSEEMKAAFSKRMEAISSIFESAYNAVAQILMFEKIKGLLPLQFVKKMFRTAFDLINDARIAFFNITFGIVNGSLNLASSAVSTTYQATTKTAGAITSGVYNGTVFVAGTAYSGLEKSKNFVVSALSSVLELLMWAQKESIGAVLSMSMDSLIFADKTFNLVGIAQWFLEKFQGIDSLQSRRITGVNLQSKVVEPLVLTGLQTTKTMDRYITGGQLREFCEDVVDEYHLRGGRILDVQSGKGGESDDSGQIAKKDSLFAGTLENGENENQNSRDNQNREEGERKTVDSGENLFAGRV